MGKRAEKRTCTLQRLANEPREFTIIIIISDLQSFIITRGLLKKNAQHFFTILCKIIKLYEKCLNIENNLTSNREHVNL